VTECLPNKREALNSNPSAAKSEKKKGTEGMYLNIIKAMYNKPIVSIMLNGEKLKPFPLK
jgi:hypothetical protein